MVDPYIYHKTTVSEGIHRSVPGELLQPSHGCCQGKYIYLFFNVLFNDTLNTF